jgi:HlyD family secretion protein
MKFSLGKTLLVVFGLALVGGVVYGFLPRAVDVDFGQVARGPLLVAVSEDGKTRIREKYVVSMPFPGRIQRITLDPGDPIDGGESVIATIYPAAPDLLNERALAEAEARVAALEQAVLRAEAAEQKAEAEREVAESAVTRVRKLHEENATTAERLEDAELMLRSKESDLSAAKFAIDIARYELDQGKAAMIRAKPREGASAEDWHYDVTAPVSGKVLRVMQESAAVLAAGAPLVEIGDPSDLEMEIDVLSQDAVRIKPGARVFVDHWGGDNTLVGHVSRIEPSGFTKISALGVEEQRVNVIADFSVPQSERSTLGDAFRVDARIALWEGEDVLQTPASALFRFGEDWCVFAVTAGRAQRRIVKIGNRNAQAAEVLEGLEEGDQVVLHPGDDLSDGSKVVPRTRL